MDIHTIYCLAITWINLKRKKSELKVYIHIMNQSSKVRQQVSSFKGLVVGGKVDCKRGAWRNVLGLMELFCIWIRVVGIWRCIFKLMELFYKKWISVDVNLKSIKKINSHETICQFNLKIYLSRLIHLFVLHFSSPIFSLYIFCLFLAPFLFPPSFLYSCHLDWSTCDKF